MRAPTTPLPTGVALAASLALVLGLPAAPAHAATRTSCGGVFGGVDFANGSITTKTTSLVAVWRTTSTTSRVTSFKRTTAGACTFTTTSTKTVATSSYAVPASTTTRTVRVRNHALPNLIERRVIGKSVQGREIVAYLVGDRKATRTAMLIGQLHGNETGGHTTAISVVNGPTIKGMKLWVIPTANPDGYAAGTRRNARGVDLNRNFDHNWVPSSKSSGTYGGPKALSEPETRALRAFLRKTSPAQVVSVHQPLFGVDGYRLKDHALAQRLSSQLGLPLKTFACSGVCHGTMVGWSNANLPGAAITVEYAKGPTKHYKTFTARRGITFALKASYA